MKTNPTPPSQETPSKAKSSPAEPEPMDTENEEETGHNRGEKRPYAEVTQDDEGDWIWVLYAKNGKPVAVSMGEWERRNDCVNSLRATLKLLSAEEKPRILITHETA